MCQESFHPLWWAWMNLMVPDWRLEGSGHPWCHTSSSCVVVDLCARFQLSSMKVRVKNIYILYGRLWGRWLFLTGDLEDGVIFEVIEHLCMLFSYHVSSFSFLFAFLVHVNQSGIFFPLFSTFFRWIKSNLKIRHPPPPKKIKPILPYEKQCNVDIVGYQNF